MLSEEEKKERQRQKELRCQREIEYEQRYRENLTTSQYIELSHMQACIENEHEINLLKQRLARIEEILDIDKTDQNEQNRGDDPTPSGPDEIR